MLLVHPVAQVVVQAAPVALAPLVAVHALTVVGEVIKTITLSMKLTSLIIVIPNLTFKGLEEGI